MQQVYLKKNFICTYELFGKKIKEGLYSPITQNERHRLVFKKMRMEGQNLLTRMFMDKHFEQYHKTIVVLANPKTYLNARFAKKEIKDQIIRADQLIAYIKEQDNKISSAEANSEEYMLGLAKYCLKHNKSERSDYARKYEELLHEFEHMASKNETEVIKEKQEIKGSERKEKTQDLKLETKENESSNKIENQTCPRCGAKLVIRTAKQGKCAGQQFWGCSEFPKCRYIENI